LPNDARIRFSARSSPNCFAAWLSWKQANLERRQLHLFQTQNGDPRTIPLNSIALAALRELQAGQPEPGTELVFPSARTGDALQESRGWFSTALEEAKIQEYTWHCNRHTFASRLVMAGVDLRTVAKLLGHRTLQMVMRYSHLAPEHQASAVARLVPAEGRVLTKSATGKFAVKKPKQTQTLTH
jgi:integrase